jgi:hypothetical protein
MADLASPLAEFAIRNLSVLSYAQGFTAWHYRMPKHPLTHALRPGFFSPAADMLEPGDTITVSAEDGGAILFVHKATIGEPVVVEPMARTTGCLAR